MGIKHFLFVGPLPTALGTALLRPHPGKQQQNCEKEEAGGSQTVPSVVNTVECVSQGQSLCILSLSLRDSVAGLGFLVHEGSLPLISHCACLVQGTPWFPVAPKQSFLCILCCS